MGSVAMPAASRPGGPGHEQAKPYQNHIDLEEFLAALTVEARSRHSLRAYLSSRQDDHPAIFLNRSGRRFSERGVALLVNRYLRGIGSPTARGRTCCATPSPPTPFRPGPT